MSRDTPPEPTWEDYEILIMEQQGKVNIELDEIRALVEPWADFSADDLAGAIKEIEERTQNLKKLEKVIADLEKDQSNCKQPIDW